MPAGAPAEGEEGEEGEEAGEEAEAPPEPEQQEAEEEEEEEEEGGEEGEEGEGGEEGEEGEEPKPKQKKKKKAFDPIPGLKAALGKAEKEREAAEVAEGQARSALELEQQALGEVVQAASASADATLYALLHLLTVPQATFHIVKALLNLLGKEPSSFATWKRAASYFTPTLFEEMAGYDATAERDMGVWARVRSCYKAVEGTKQLEQEMPSTLFGVVALLYIKQVRLGWHGRGTGAAGVGRMKDQQLLVGAGAGASCVLALHLDPQLVCFIRRTHTDTCRPLYCAPHHRLGLLAFRVLQAIVTNATRCSPPVLSPPLTVLLLLPSLPFHSRYQYFFPHPQVRRVARKAVVHRAAAARLDKAQADVAARTEAVEEAERKKVGRGDGGAAAGGSGLNGWT